MTKQIEVSVEELKEFSKNMMDHLKDTLEKLIKIESMFNEEYENSKDEKKRIVFHVVRNRMFEVKVLVEAAIDYLTKIVNEEGNITISLTKSVSHLGYALISVDDVIHLLNWYSYIDKYRDELEIIFSRIGVIRLKLSRFLKD